MLSRIRFKKYKFDGVKMLAEYENYILVVSMFLGFYLLATILKEE